MPSTTSPPRPDFNHLGVDDMRRLDEVCDAFEVAIRPLLPFDQDAKAQMGPLIEAYAARVPPGLRELCQKELSDVCRRYCGPEADDGLMKPPPVPPVVDGYQILRHIGRGGFADVYLARDERLRRMAALKVPIEVDPAGYRQAGAEAPSLASLDHHAIIKVFHSAFCKDGRPFLAMEYAEGGTLEARMAHGGPLDQVWAAGMLVDVALAINHAHSRNLIHRDLKPSNILLTPRGETRVSDFGLALYDDSRGGLRPGEVAGTWPYMAPEQVRGEAHLIDGRTDIWAIGVILYRCLTGRLPFRGESRSDFEENILRKDPTPPCAVNYKADPRLQRICLRCLEREMRKRYDTAADLAADLRDWLVPQERPDREPSPPPTQLLTPKPQSPAENRPTGQDVNLDSTVVIEPPDPPSPPAVKPRGLRAFDGDDEGFFLRLLPGQRGAGEIPESVWFWKRKVEAAEVERSFRVGLIYGPSGGGKSSFASAGLIPRLDRGAVRVVTVEATPRSTEADLLARLKQAVPRLADKPDLASALRALRERKGGARGPKILIVIDQFEQWLQANTADLDAPLVLGLRQCDGPRVQALVLVRDDFWMAVTRFFRALDLPVSEKFVSQPVEPFDASHARGVLESFGLAWDRFTGPAGRPSAEESTFLDAAVSSLAGTDGLVRPVWLCLLAEVVRKRRWVSATLDELGGMGRVGFRFLEQSFDLSSSPPHQRVHAEAAAAVLEALLPPRTSAIRGRARLASELREVSGYAGRPEEFDELTRVLDHDLRMISLADPHTAPGRDGSCEPAYQLAHDDLVEPVREWVDSKRVSTPRGRARLRLELITGVWATRPGKGRLPSLSEWGSILRHTRRSTWSEGESSMMRAATRYHIIRATCALALVGLLVAGGLRWRSRDETSRLVTQALGSSPTFLPTVLRQLDQTPALASELLERVDTTSPAPRVTLLAHRYRPTDERSVALRGRLAVAGPAEAEQIAEALGLHPTRRVAESDSLWKWACDRHATPGGRLRAAAALARLDPADARWSGLAPAVARALGVERASEVSGWATLLAPARQHWLAALSVAVIDPAIDANGRAAAAEALAAVRPGEDALAAALADASPEVFRVLTQALGGDGGPLAGVGGRAAAAVEAVAKRLASLPKDPDPARDAGRRANLIVALAQLGRPADLWAGLRHAADPTLRATLIDAPSRLGANPSALTERLRALPAVADASERQGVVLALAELAERSPDAFSRADRADLVKAADALFREDGDPGVHSAASLLARRLGHTAVEATVPAADPGAGKRPAAGKNWYVGPNGHTFAVVGPLAGWVGTDPKTADTFAQDDARDDETRQYLKAPAAGRSLAVATTEVTFGQIWATKVGPPSPTAGQDAAAGYLSWYDAARYCNWLNESAGIPRDQWCYPEPVGPGMTLDAASVERTGYRLPTEVEWELFCRAGTETRRPFGDGTTLLSRYAWTWLNSDDRLRDVARLLPNEYGLFDTLGNAWEVCQDGPDSMPPVTSGDYPAYPYPAGSKAEPGRVAPRTQVITGTPRADVPGEPRTFRIVRGGAYDYSPENARPARRDYALAKSGWIYLGLRVVRTLPND